MKRGAAKGRPSLFVVNSGVSFGVSWFVYSGQIGATSDGLELSNFRKLF